jgi:hypothetical protein
LSRASVDLSEPTLVIDAAVVYQRSGYEYDP